jgi:hypothetical protein
LLLLTHLLSDRGETQTSQNSWVARRLRLESFGRAHKDDDGLRAGRRRNQGLIPHRFKGFSFSTASRPALERTQPPIQLVPGTFARGYSGRSVKLTTHLHLVLSGAIPQFPHTPSRPGMCLCKRKDNFNSVLSLGTSADRCYGQNYANRSMVHSF